MPSLRDSKRPHAGDFAPEVMQLFDQYVHGQIDRRGFLEGAARYAAGAAGAAALLAALSPKFVQARQVAEDDPRMLADYVEIDSPQGYGKVRAYRARPAVIDAPLPAVLVVHENRGLNPHIEDVARRLALQGYLALAPDALFPLGGYPGDEDAARALFPQLDQAKCREDFEAAARWLLTAEGSSGALGAVGFCYGGAIVNLLATRVPELAAAAPYYGGPAPLDAVPQIRAELLVVLASDDERINATWPDYEAALKAAGVEHALFQPDNTLHGFHNDTTPRYSEAAARDAWQLTLDLFARRLRAG
ncbi:MAG: dienelactone hydrolase family protein [Aquimonas sp.]|nr:dienelactone hydrolase family protein [Aquimonas sp.]